MRGGVRPKFAVAHSGRGTEAELQIPHLEQ